MMHDESGWLEQVREGLSELGRLDPEHREFGAAAHRYTLHPVLTEAEVARVEAAYGFRLPDDYRAFLLGLGNGGAGPGYGLFKLGERDDGMGHAPWGTWVHANSTFPHEEAWNDTDLLTEGAPDPDDFDDEDEYDEALSEWEESDEALDAAAEYESQAGLGDGLIPLCHLGCSQREWLVVAGPDAGHVWFDGLCDQLGVKPVRNDAGEKLTFSAWYLAWLNRSLESLRGE